jgi:hypothetical protein
MGLIFLSRNEIGSELPCQRHALNSHLPEGGGEVISEGVSPTPRVTIGAPGGLIAQAIPQRLRRAVHQSGRPPSSSVTAQIGAGRTPTFAIFVQGTG